MICKFSCIWSPIKMIDAVEYMVPIYNFWDRFGRNWTTPAYYVYYRYGIFPYTEKSNFLYEAGWLWDRCSIQTHTFVRCSDMVISIQDENCVQDNSICMSKNDHLHRSWTDRYWGAIASLSCSGDYYDTIGSCWSQ